MIILAEFVVELDASIVNIALPTIARDLHATTSELQWVVDAYILALASLLVFCGAMVDSVGARRMLFGATAAFFGASILAALSKNATELIATRVAMGVAAAIILPATLAILVAVFPSDKRAHAFSIWSSVAGLSFVLGPTLGGWLVERDGWSAVFLINLPILAIALAAGVAILPRAERGHGRRGDPVGMLLAVAGLTSLVYGVIEASNRGWGSVPTVTVLVAGTAFLSAFATREAHKSELMRDLHGLQGTGVVPAITVLAMTFMPVTGSLFIVTQYLQGVLGYAPLAAGVRILPVAIAFIVAALLSVSLSRRIGTKLTVAAGLGLLASALLILSTVSEASGYSLVLWALLVGGSGMGLALTPATEMVLAALPISRAGLGSALNTTALTIGGALGVAVLGSVLSSRYISQLPVNGFARLGGHSLGGALGLAAQRGGADGARIALQARHVFVEAMPGALWVGAAVAGTGAALALACMPRAAITTSREPGDHAQPGRPSDLGVRAR